MNWNSRRISAILSNALMEDQATHDATTLATIEPHQRAHATILAKEDCVLAGLKPGTFATARSAKNSRIMA